MKPTFRLAALAVTLLACGRTSLLPDEPCDLRGCPAGYACNLVTGLCEHGDGGFIPGPGPVDGGRDGGVVDAGHHPDGGPVFCPGGCPNGTFCDESAPPDGRCVRCLNDDHCNLIRPVCDRVAGECVRCTWDQHCQPPQGVCKPQGQVCVECLNDSHCSAPRPFCDTATNTCTSCLFNSQCANPTPVCNLSSGQCTACSRDNQCPAGSRCQMGSCITTPDSCASPQEVMFLPGTTSTVFQVVTSSAQNDHDGSCAPGGRELVYKLSLTSHHNVVITAARAAGSSANPAIYVRRASCDSGLELACANTSQTFEILTLQNLAPGDYYLFVESVGGTAGAIDVNVSLTPAAPPPSNDSCIAPRKLSFFNDVAVESGDTSLAANDTPSGSASPTCSVNARLVGRDVVYAFTLSETRDVSIFVTPHGINPLPDPVVYLRKSGACSSPSAGDELGCKATTGINPTTMDIKNLPPGTHYIWVDSNQSAGGSFQLAVTLAAPSSGAGDGCSGPINLSVGQPVTGETLTANDDYSRNSVIPYGPACTSDNTFPFTGKDRVYQFVATKASHTATLAPAATFDPALILLQPSCGPAFCSAYSDNTSPGAAEVLTFNTTPGQTYYLVVDSWNGSAGFSSGSYSLTVQ